MKLVIFFLTLFSSYIFALETDQFLASFHEIKDSKEVLNNYFNQQILKAVNNANASSKKLECRQIADDVLSNLVGKYSISKVSQFAKTSPEIDRFPDLSVSDKEYFKMTFYEQAGILMKIAPLARTINLNGIYMGTDKLGHFSLVGRNYYRAYLKNLEKGMNRDAAFEAAIVRGFKTERGILGYGIGGVLSFGDLEANYQGFKFATDLCEGNNPILIKEDAWKINPNHTFDLANYFNPRMDESFNFSFWRPYLWKKINAKIKDEYCVIKNDERFITRINSYQNKINRNLNDELIEKHLKSMAKFDRKLEDLEKLCHDN